MRSCDRLAFSAIWSSTSRAGRGETHLCPQERLSRGMMKGSVPIACHGGEKARSNKLPALPARHCARNGNAASGWRTVLSSSVFVSSTIPRYGILTNRLRRLRILRGICEAVITDDKHCLSPPPITLAGTTALTLTLAGGLQRQQHDPLSSLPLCPLRAETVSRRDGEWPRVAGRFRASNGIETG